MCDTASNMSITAQEMNTTPLPPSEESTKMDSVLAKGKDDAVMVGSQELLVPTESNSQPVTKDDVDGKRGKETEMNDEDASSSGDEEEDDDDEEEEDGGTATKNTLDGGTSVLQVPQRYTKSGRKRSIPFPVRLMTVLSDPKFSHIIEWLPSGKSFVIYKPKVFATDILPSTFKSAKYSSFTRKLHRWGFVRHFRGGESGAFFHPDFQKGRLDLAEAMTCCQQQKETASKKARKAKLLSSKKQASADPSIRLASSIRKSGVANFRNVLGSSNPTAAAVLQHNQTQLMSRAGIASAGTPSMRLPYMSSSGVSSGVADALQSYSSHSLPGVVASGRNTLNQYAGMLGAAGSVNRLGGKYPEISVDTSSSGDLTAQQQQQAMMKAQLDVAIKEELARIEYARLTKERLATANAAHRYNVLLHQQQRHRGSNSHMLLGGTFPSDGDGHLGGITSSSLMGSGYPVAPSSSSSLLGGGGRSTSSIAPVLSQLSRAELEQYAMAMSTRNQHTSQLMTSPNFSIGANIRGTQRRSNPF